MQLRLIVQVIITVTKLVCLDHTILQGKQYASCALLGLLRMDHKKCFGFGLEYSILLYEAHAEKFNWLSKSNIILNHFSPNQKVITVGRSNQIWT